MKYLFEANSKDIGSMFIDAVFLSLWLTLSE